MSKKLTLYEIKERLRAINPNIEILSDEYVNAYTNLHCRCIVEGCNHEWYPNWANLSQKRGCPKCSRNNVSEKQRLPIEQVKKEFINKGYTPIFEKYINANGKLDATDNEGYKVYINIDSLRTNNSSPKFENSNPYVIDNIKLWLSKNNSKYKLLSEIYINAKHKLDWYCADCNSIFKSDWDKIQSGGGCGACYGRQVSENNSLYSLRPDLHKYIIDLEYAKTVSLNSNKKISVKCPDCGNKKTKEVSINYLSSRGFSCEYCSDGISIPEKFGIYLLKQLNINFKTQKNFTWSNKKRYDQYFTLNNSEFIMEIMGEQHYKYSGFKHSLKEEQNNDLLKYNLAIQNGIKPENYIVVDCRHSTLEWLKNNFTKSLDNIFDLSDIDWLKVWEDCQSSLVIEACQLWNNREENDTTATVSQFINIGISAFVRYLKIGNQLNMCNYNAHEEKIKLVKKLHIKQLIPVNQYDRLGNFIKKYNSITDASLSTGVARDGISKCVKGELKTSGGFVWRCIE